MSGRERLTGLDAAWFRMDRPRNTADVVGMLTFAEPFPEPALEALLAERLLRHRRFRQRVRGGLVAAWEDDPGFRLSRHLAFQRLPPGAASLRALLAEVASEPLPAHEPPWRVRLVHQGTRSALVMKLQHGLGDGFALIGLLLALSDEAGRSALPPPPPPPALAHAARLGPAARLAGSAAALARMATLPRGPPTRLSRPPTGARAVAWTGPLPLERLREAAHARGARLNDLLVAALAGALRRLLSADGAPVDRLEVRALVPVNLRRELPGAGGEPGLGNRFGLAYLELPVRERAAEARLRAVHHRMAALKASLDPVVTAGVLSGLGRCPAAVERLVVDHFGRRASLVLSAVRGPPARLHLGGHRIEGALFCVPHPATLGLGVSVLSYAGAVRLAVRADRAVLDRPARLVGAFEEELSGLAPVARLPRRGRSAPSRVARPRRALLNKNG